MFFRMIDTTQLMQRMFARLRIDVPAACRAGHSPEIAQVVGTCQTCANTDQCRAWLAEGGPNGGYHRFCPNAGRLDVLAQG